MTQTPNNLFVDPQPVEITKPRHTPASFAAAIGTYVLALIRTLGWLVLAAAACGATVLSLRAIVFFYHLTSRAIGLEVGHG